LIRLSNMNKKISTPIALGIILVLILYFLWCFVFTCNTDKNLNENNFKRKADIYEVSMIMKAYYNINHDKYLQSEILPKQIGDLLSPMPQDPGKGPCSSYQWISNVSDSSKYCIYACLTDGKFYVASPSGVTTTDKAPTDLNCGEEINGMACTEEAKICPDGSSVVRTGPDCEFAPCPTTSTLENELSKKIIQDYIFCNEYEDYLKNELETLNKQCENNNDCNLTQLYNCEPYCVSKEVNLFLFYSNLKKKRPSSCPYYTCRDPSINWNCACEKNICTLKKYGTADWKTYRKEEYGFEIKYPESLIVSNTAKTNTGIESFLDYYLKIKYDSALYLLDFNETDKINPACVYSIKIVNQSIKELENKCDENFFTSWEDYQTSPYYSSSAEYIPNQLSSKKEFFVYSYKGIEYSWQLPAGGPSEKMILMPNNSKTYIISRSYFSSVCDENIFNQMLYTFKFID
jgi:hypothetical protein